MTRFTIEDIRKWRPCYDPSRHLPEGWSGTAVDILKIESIPPQDRLWVVLREEVLDQRTLRLFAVACARRVQHLMTDPRSIAALDVAERHARGEATDEELGAAETEVAKALVKAAARAAEWAAEWAAKALVKAARATAAAAEAAAVWAAERHEQVRMLLEMIEEAS